MVQFKIKKVDFGLNISRFLIFLVIYSIIVGIIICAASQFFTDLFYYLPRYLLANWENMPSFVAKILSGTSANIIISIIISTIIPVIAFFLYIIYSKISISKEYFLVTISPETIHIEEYFFTKESSLVFSAQNKDLDELKIVVKYYLFL